MGQDRVAGILADTPDRWRRPGQAATALESPRTWQRRRRRPAIGAAAPEQSPAGAGSEAITIIFLSLVTTRQDEPARRHYRKTTVLPRPAL